MIRSTKCCYDFGPFHLDSAKRFLLRDGEVVAITPKIFDTLLALIENCGEVVERKTLIQRLWSDSYVEESNLTYNISILRKALGEHPDEHRYITTIPGQGYLFVAEVRETLETNLNGAEESHTKPTVTSELMSQVQDKTIDSLAVLPLVNAGGDSNSEYLSDGITDGIINSLSQLLQLRVLSRNIVFRYKGQDVNAQEVGRELEVRAVLLGRVTQFAERLIIKAELVDVIDGRQLWGAQYNREMSNILKIEEEISLEISEALRLKLTGKQKQRLTKRYTENAEAHDLYLKGLYHWNRFVREGTVKALEYFQQAIEIDPDYAHAHAKLSDAYYRLSNIYFSPLEAMPKAKSAALRSVELDATLAEARTALAVVKDQFDWDWVAAEREYRKAIEYNSNCVIARQRYSRYLVRMGRFDEALENLQIALELDPLSLQLNLSLGSLLLMMRDYNPGIDQLEKVLEMNPNYYPAHFGLAQANQFKGDLDIAISEYRKTLLLEDSVEILGRFGQALAIAGKSGEARKIISKMKEKQKHQYVSPFCIGLVYAGLGDKEHAFAWLEKTFEERNEMLTWIRVHPELDSLRSDSRFTNLLQRVGLVCDHCTDEGTRTRGRRN